MDSEAHWLLSDVVRHGAIRRYAARSSTVTIRKFKTGSFSKIYVLTCGTEKIILKCRFANAEQSGCSIKNEIIALKTLGDRLRVPRLLFVGEPSDMFGDGYLALEYINGEMPAPGEAAADKLSGYFAALHLQQVRDLDLPDGSRHLLGKVVDTCGQLLAKLSADPRADLTLIRRYEAAFRTFNAETTSSDPLAEDLVCSHGDPVPGNFLICETTGLLYGIDWETFSASTFVFDLWASIAPAFNRWNWPRSFSRKERARFVDRYCSLRGIDRLEARALINLMSPAYSFRYSLWCANRYLVSIR